MLPSTVARAFAASCMVLIFTAPSTAGPIKAGDDTPLSPGLAIPANRQQALAAAINTIPEKNDAVVRVASKPVYVSGKGISDSIKRQLISSTAGRPVYHLVSGTDRKQATGSRASPPVVYVPHANAGALRTSHQSSRAYQPSQPAAAASSLYQPLVGPIVNSGQQPASYRVVRVYRPPAPTQPALMPPTASPTNFVTYHQPPPPQTPSNQPQQHQALPQAPAPAAPMAVPAASPVVVPVAPASNPAAPPPLQYPHAVSASEVTPVNQQEPALHDVLGSTTAQSVYVEEGQCPQLHDDPCLSLEAGLYAHPSASTCFVQCDQFGQSHIRPCAPGTFWKPDSTSQDKPSLFNKCS